MFAGLKILELASVLAGPGVGQFFAELGAEVIKVENKLTGGDVTRTWKGSQERTDDRSAYFSSVNWGKKSIALDLTNEKDRRTVRALALRSDMIIASYKPGDAEKLGVAYSQLTADHPRLIYGQISGYGPDNDRVGYDAVLQAETGFMDLNGEKSGPPTKMPVALIDVLAGHQLKEGLLIALLKKERSGKGSLVEVSLVQTAIASLVNQAGNWLVANHLPARQGSNHPNIAPYGESFTTADGKRILLAVGSDRQFEDLCGVLSIEKVGMFSTNPERIRNRGELFTILQSRISKKKSGELLEAMHKSKIPAGVIQNVQEVFEMPEAKEMMLISGDRAGVRSFAVKDSGHWMGNKILPPPHFGEHTEEILGLIS